MEKLRVRSRLQRLAAQRRALAPLDDNQRQGAWCYWNSLPGDAKCEALRFDDPSLVQRVHGHMDRLVRAELWARSNGLGDVAGGQSSDGSSLRLQGFGFEAPAERDCLGRQQEPTAFGATEEFSENEHLLEDLQQLLGSPLLDGRTILQRQDWHTVMEDTPGSWQELQVQVFKLVELAILHAFVEAGSPEEPGATPAKQGTSTGPSASAKRRMRKKKKNAAATQAADDALGVSVQAECSEGANQLALDAEEGADAEDVCDGVENDLAIKEAFSCPEENTASSSTEGNACDAAGSKFPPPIAEQVYIDPKPPASRSGLMSTQEVSCWSAWLPSFVNDGSAEWRWMIFQPQWGRNAEGEKVRLPVQPEEAGVRAYVKNTFVDVEWMSKTETAARNNRRHKSSFF